MKRRTLDTIQNMALIGKILSTVGFVFSIIGVIGCAVGLAALAMGLDDSAVIGDLVIRWIDIGTEFDFGTACASLAMGLINCIAEMIVADKSVRYFKQELADGTPFTFCGAKKMLQLGVLAAAVPLAAMVINAVVYEVLNRCFTIAGNVEQDNSAAVIIGVMFIAVSFLCRYGAELGADRAVGRPDGEVVKND